MSLFLQFLFPPPASLFVNAMSFISFTGLANGGLSEVKGNNIGYSKFWSSDKKKGKTVPSKIGMLIAYTPALTVSLASFVMYDVSEPRSLLLYSAISLHYLKRVLEVLFVHRYSGQMALDAATPISLSYFTNTAVLIYAQSLARANTEPAVDLKYAGVVLFLIGIIGNFYHHFELSKLRKENDKGYKMPKGGLFDLITCPHYLFEIIEFIGIACMSQTIYGFCFTLGTMCYLAGRSYATRKWYLSKFENFPVNIKAFDTLCILNEMQ